METPSENVNSVYFPMLEPLIRYIPCVTTRVYFSRFVFSNDIFRTILETCFRVIEIDLIKCEIHIDDSFVVNPYLNYQIQVLNLKWSVVKNKS